MSNYVRRVLISRDRDRTDVGIKGAEEFGRSSINWPGCLVQEGDTGVCWALTRMLEKKMLSVSDSRKKLGAWGEDQAAKHLQSLGYNVLERNWRCRRGEIDLVAQAGEILVFVEVKTRRGRDFGTPEEAITGAKAKRLLELGQRYLLEHDLDDQEWRVDLVAVELSQDGLLLRCEHIPNIVWAW